MVMRTAAKLDNKQSIVILRQQNSSKNALTVTIHRFVSSSSMRARWR
jgi:hypothetical protein